MKLNIEEVKTIKKTSYSNKALIAFMLVFFFLFMGLSKSMAFTIAPLKAFVKAEASSLVSKTIITAIADTEVTGFNLLDQIGDTDSGDLDIAIFKDGTFKLFSPAHEKQFYADAAPFHYYGNVALYDLFCNWKLHVA